MMNLSEIASKSQKKIKDLSKKGKDKIIAIKNDPQNIERLNNTKVKIGQWTEKSKDKIEEWGEKIGEFKNDPKNIQRLNNGWEKIKNLAQKSKQKITQLASTGKEKISDLKEKL